MGSIRWLRSADSNSVLNLNHVVALVVEEDKGTGTSRQRRYRVVAITVLGHGTPVAVGLPSREHAQDWINEYVTTMRLTDDL